MYVVWPKDSYVQSQQDGIDKVIECIERTNGEYGWCKKVISDRVRNSASEQADYEADDIPEHDNQGHWRGHQIIDEERNRVRKKFVQEYGQRAVYEVRVRHVGNVDAAGRFTEVEKKKR